MALILETLMYHPSFFRLLRLLEKTAGRERLLRVIQYLSLFMAFHRHRTGYSQSSSRFWTNISKHLSLARKPFRALRPLSLFHAATTIMDDRLRDSVLRLSGVVRNISFAIYLTIDTINWLMIIGVIGRTKITRRWIRDIGYRFCLLGLISGMINSLRRLQIGYDKKNALKNECDYESEKDLINDNNNEIYQSQKKFIWDLLDVIIISKRLKYVDVDDGIVGISGVVTSFFGLSDVWSSLK